MHPKRTLLASVAAATLGGLAGFATAVGLLTVLSAWAASPGAAGGEPKGPAPQERRLDDVTPGHVPVLRYAARPVGETFAPSLAYL